VQLGKESHFCPPQLAPEYRTTVALCRSVATWLQTEPAHVAVVATSRQRAALLAVCIQAYLEPDHGCATAAELFKKVGRQLFAMCDDVGRRVPECEPFKAHQCFLRHWSRTIFSAAPAIEIAPAAAGAAVDRDAAWVTGSRVWIHEIAVSGLNFDPHHRLVAMISQGEQLVFSSLNGSPLRPPSKGGQARATALRVPIVRECDADADLVIRLYRMIEQTSTERASQNKLCSISFSIKFCRPKGRDNGADGLRSFTITAADIDDAEISDKFRLVVVTGAEKPAMEPSVASSESGGGVVAVPEPVGVLIPGAARRPDAMAMSYSLDDDAAMALSLQREYDIEASSRGGGSRLSGAVASRQSDGGDIVAAESGAIDGTASADSAGSGQPSPGPISSSIDEERLATDEAFARALQDEFNQAARPRAGSGRGSGPVEDEHAALARLLQDNPAEFLGLVMGRGSSSRRSAHMPHCVATLPTGTVGVAQLENECQVCFETYTIGETFRTLPCMHIYHRDCIDPWLLSKRDPTCPVCLTKVDQS
jgi:hypothetical protein